MIELLAPAGDIEKLKTALHFGADAVYLSGKDYGLRAFAANFDADGLKDALSFIHAHGKKAYVTVNIFAKNSDFGELKEYLCYLYSVGADAVIVSDPGIISFIKKHVPQLKIHLSTQANTTNKYSAQFWAEYVDRIILARELTLIEIAEIHEFLPYTQLESFVHGAMCVSYSGRCLLSDVLTGRAANRGECVQACRWQYKITDPEGRGLEIGEDARGSYLLNSKDLNMLAYLDKLAAAGITSFKIEGRAKSPYYVAGAVGAYKRAIDILQKGGTYICPPELLSELDKISHRVYHTGFYFGAGQQCLESSKAEQTYEFSAVVTDVAIDIVAGTAIAATPMGAQANDQKRGIIAEQRNRFKKGDCLEVLSPGRANGVLLRIENMFALDGKEITDALNVQQKLYIPTALPILAGDILRRKL